MGNVNAGAKPRDRADRQGLLTGGGATPQPPAAWQGGHIG
jgi:hypothetical protein